MFLRQLQMLMLLLQLVARRSDARPSTDELLLSSLLSEQPLVFNCQVCCDDFPGTSGLLCGRQPVPHFVCSDCASRYAVHR